MVRQPARLIALLLVAGCGLQKAPEPPVPPNALEDSLVFRLHRPGATERWKTLSGQDAVFQRQSGHLKWRAGSGEQKQVRGRLAWSNWGILGDCLGSPLRALTGGDPGAFRNLHIQGRRASWVLHLSGLNRCALGGRVVVDVVRDQVETDLLNVDGIPWSSGGRQRAQAVLRAETRDTAPDEWASLDTVGRILLLKRLSDDPDPRAEESLLALKALDPTHADDIDAALERRGLRLSP